ncbi:dentin sialophosphoprotein-like isoform X1 [Bombus bifarius]|uniref:Dentin sialophosphoprotein-like isoform X1 n=1 Tax=Bombus bifarius TaxID=103933 RepID=A0A6P8LX95_9HYME|nr:dentin sialophosphoprotein-like isoform X1 [Bombus vancouverensis nearcticus]XP_033191023.1 dentin sialophosphoprotein-like isoform X1 [Bombus vancouverensis nearcticus]XP_033191024.1 dentin sialophosphoprotein-like isoform X1 [Bombus vancouverensis nearcticus]XP_033191026.1 dentin sialophosphoprotein-like isoform X1 [Bombus vancouverensis nearcticus]XP_033191027.1 dentin sialophosphoprotein-like isoform X1 [Bombus vancouverensis nearcticus]XP_033191028.1 dentin sialophosphoprotein-like iso
MLQLRVIVVLLVPMCVSLLVGRATSLYASREEHPSKVDIGNLKEPTDILSNSSSKATTSSIKAAEDNTGIKTANETNNSTLTNTANAGVNTPVEKTIDEKKEDNEKLNNSKQNNVKLNNDKQNSENLNNKEQNSEKLNKEQVNNETRINEKQNSEEQNDRKENCTSTKETEDMLHCNKYPRDDDGDSLNATESTITNTTTANNNTGSTTESQVPEVIPHEKEKGDAKDEELSGNNTQTTTEVHYAIVPSDTNHTIYTNNSDVPNSTDSKDSTNTIETSHEVNKVENISSEAIEAVKSDQSNSKHMSSGIIALVTAISFAVVIALVYIGMIVWRRYIEYRYGHRELLVNELEFDTNDLRHFEL